MKIGDAAGTRMQLNATQGNSLCLNWQNYKLINHLKYATYETWPSLATSRLSCGFRICPHEVPMAGKLDIIR